jgi:pimeloyl-ACP methyl ester carboxylesterase
LLQAEPVNQRPAAGSDEHQVRPGDTRAIAEQLCLSPRTVEHHLSAAYRKLGVRNRVGLVALLRDNVPDQTPVTHYALSGDTHIAYQVLGDGPRDLVLIPGFVSNVETAWTWPAQARFLRRLAAGRRLIVFDKRGTGLSDPVADPSCLTLEQRMDEVRAVMDAAGTYRAALFGFSEGVALAMLFAASYPSRTNGLILYGGLISPTLDTAANAVVNVFADPAAAGEIMRQVWGSGQFMAPFLPTATSTESGWPTSRASSATAPARRLPMPSSAWRPPSSYGACVRPCTPRAWLCTGVTMPWFPRPIAGTWQSISLTCATSTWKAPIIRSGSVITSDSLTR